MKIVSKEMRKRQKHFPWMETSIKEFCKTYPNCKKTLQCLVENIEKEVKELKKGHKRKAKALFETVKDLYLHFWWKIHWKKNSQWKNYWNVDTTHSYNNSEITKYFGKLLNFLIYLGIILSQGASDSLWINRVLQAINILPAADGIVYDALLQLQCLKKKYQSSYMEILRHVLCSEIILDISEPAIYIKSLMLFRRLKNSIKDEVAKASLISTASKIKPPSNLASWLSSLEISVDVDKSIVDQLFKKNSKQVFQKLYHVLIESENDDSSESKNKERNSKYEKKSENYEKEEANLLRMTIGLIETPNKDINSNVRPFENIKNSNEKNNQLKTVLELPELCSTIKKSKKKKKHTAMDVNGKINLVSTESSTKLKQQPKNTKTGNLIERTLDSQNISTKHKKSKKKKKPKARNDAAGTNVINKKASKNTKSGSKSKKSRKTKKSEEIDDRVNVILDNKKSDLSNLNTHSNEANSSNNDYSVLVKSEFHTERSSQTFEYANDKTLSENNLIINEEKKSEDDENDVRKKVKFTHSAAENQISQTNVESHTACVKSCDDKMSDGNYLKSKLPNLLANYENYSSGEENKTAKRDVSTCPLVESADEVLVPDTCQNDFNSIVPFNLDLWVPNNDTSRDTSVSNDGSTKTSNRYKNNQSDYSSFNDSTAENIIDSEVSRDTLFSNDGSQISDKYPYVSLIDIRKNKKLSLFQISDNSNSTFYDSILGDINDSEMSRDTLIANEESRILDKDPNANKKADKIADGHSDSNYDPILGNVNNNEVIDFSSQNTDNSSCHDLHITKNRNDESQNTQGENNHGANEIKESELPCDETSVQGKKFQENQSPCNKHSKTKITSPTKRKRKQASYKMKKQQKRKYSSVDKDFVQPRGGNCCQDSETSAKDVNGNAYLNDLSTLLPNHGEIETQENEAVSPSTGIALNHSNTQDMSQLQEPNALREESNIMPREPAPHTFLANTKKQPCITLQNENHRNDTSTYPIETVIDEFIESELSNVHSVRLSDNVIEKAHVERVHSVGKNAFNPFQARSNLVPSHCFGYKSNVNTPHQNNMLSVSSTTENRSVENEVAQSLLNLSVDGNSRRIALTRNPEHRNENTNIENASLNSSNPGFVVDCNIINDFESRNSSRAGSSVSGDTPTIKVVLNLIHTKPENSSNLNSQIPFPSGNGFLAASNSQCQHSSVAPSQVMNNSNCSLPIHGRNNYFSEPPFFIRRTANELDSPPDRESQMGIPGLPRVKNMISSFSNDETNFITPKPKGRCSTPNNLSRKRQRNGFSHSSESTNEWDLNQLDLNTSFSNIPSVQTEHCEDVVNALNVHRPVNNHSEKGNQNKELISRTVTHTASTGEKTAFHDPKQIISYRNSRPSIYSDESEDELSVSTLSLLSGEETDHSLLKIVDDEISPKTFPHRKKNNASKVKTKRLFREEKWVLDSLTPGSSVVKKPTPQKKKRQKKSSQKY